MPGGGRKKQWHEMTHREILSALVAFTVIGLSILVAMISTIVELPEWHPLLLLWPGAGILFVAIIVGLSYVQALREFRRRRMNDQDS